MGIGHHGEHFKEGPIRDQYGVLKQVHDIVFYSTMLKSSVRRVNAANYNSISFTLYV